MLPAFIQLLSSIPTCTVAVVSVRVVMFFIKPDYMFVCIHVLSCVPGVIWFLSGRVYLMTRQFVLAGGRLKVYPRCLSACLSAVRCPATPLQLSLRRCQRNINSSVEFQCMDVQPVLVALWLVLHMAKLIVSIQNCGANRIWYCVPFIRTYVRMCMHALFGYNWLGFPDLRQLLQCTYGHTFHVRCLLCIYSCFGNWACEDLVRSE